MEKELTELEKAQEIINAETKKIDEACWLKVNEVLIEFNRALMPYGQFNGNQIQVGISLIKTN